MPETNTGAYGLTELDQNPRRQYVNRHIRILRIAVNGRRITVPLHTSSCSLAGAVESSSSDAEKFYDYLRLYRRYVLESPDETDTARKEN